MSDNIVGAGTVSYLSADGEWIPLGSGRWNLEEPAPYEPEQVYKYSSLKFKAISVKATFTPSPEFWGIIVGMRLQYGLRELYRNLARYASWPYTN